MFLMKILANQYKCSGLKVNNHQLIQLASKTISQIQTSQI